MIKYYVNNFWPKKEVYEVNFETGRYKELIGGSSGQIFGIGETESWWTNETAEFKMEPVTKERAMNEVVLEKLKDD